MQTIDRFNHFFEIWFSSPVITDFFILLYMTAILRYEIFTFHTVIFNKLVDEIEKNKGALLYTKNTTSE